MPDYVCAADRRLSIDSASAWDGAASESSIFSWAGWPDSPDPGKAKRGFLCYSPADGKLKGAYKLPFARVIHGRLVAVAGGLRAAASRLPQADIPDSVRSEARAVLDGYFKRMGSDTGRRDATSELLWKSFEAQPRSVDPGDVEIAAIRKFAQRDIEPGEVYTGRMVLANDRYDRAHERFPRAYLERFAETLPGKSVMIGHDYQRQPVGRFYDASVVGDEEGHHLKVGFYVNRKNEQLVSDIELGILKDVSIGFNAGSRTCDLCGKVWTPRGRSDCEHWPGEEFDGNRCTLTYAEAEAHKAEAMEGSFVWHGCQYGAQAVAKGFDLDEARNLYLVNWDSREGESSGAASEESMTEQELMAEVERLKADLAAAQPFIEDGKRFRQYQKEEITRLASLLEETEIYAPVLATLKEAGADSLEPVRKKLAERVDKKFAQGDGKAGAAEELKQRETQEVKRSTWRDGLIARVMGG